MKKIKTALISVHNKKNLKLLLKNLSKHKIKIISSGGTFKEIKKMGYKCIEVSKYTGSKEILDGRVKTLHPKIHVPLQKGLQLVKVLLLVVPNHCRTTFHRQLYVILPCLDSC
mgnify:CR=1 FL=1